jgi:hypothetical protein
VIRRVIATTAVFFLLFCTFVSLCSRWGSGYLLSPPGATTRWLLLKDGLVVYEHSHAPTGPLHWLTMSAWVVHSGWRTDLSTGKRIGWMSVDLPAATSVLYPAVLILVIWHFRHHRQRPRPGLCPTCGYDLRASKNRCPECGTPIAGETKISA